jgi:hypothetical protein
MMGTVSMLPTSRAATSVQLSAYPQDDGSSLYCVEVLFDDDTWDRSFHTKDRAEGWKLAGKEAIDRRVPLLPTSTFPGRAA